MKLQFIFTNIFIWAKLCIVMKRFSLERNWLPCQSNADDSARKHMKTFLWLQIATLQAFDGGLVGFLIQRKCKISLSLFLMWNNWWEPLEVGAQFFLDRISGNFFTKNGDFPSEWITENGDDIGEGTGDIFSDCWNREIPVTLLSPFLVTILSPNMVKIFSPEMVAL